MTEPTVGQPAGDPRFSWAPGTELPSRPAPPPAPATALRPVAYSRWRGGSTSFGPMGRLVATLLVVGIGVALLVVDPLSGIIWLAIAGPLALPSIWKRERIR
jgi:hypothetical protein